MKYFSNLYMLLDKFLLFFYIKILLTYNITFISLVAQLVKNLPAMQETPVRFLGQKDLLEK